jgi:hypothetical protein
MSRKNTFLSPPGIGGCSDFVGITVPLPRVASWEALNLHLREESRRDQERWIGERSQSVGAAIALEREHLRALAEEGFDPAAVHFPHVNGSGCEGADQLLFGFSVPVPVGGEVQACKPRCTRRTWRSGGGQ